LASEKGYVIGSATRRHFAHKVPAYVAKTSKKELKNLAQVTIW
jgi:hypothetical protein